MDPGGNINTETHHLVFCEGERRRFANIIGTPHPTPGLRSSDVSAGGAKTRILFQSQLSVVLLHMVNCTCRYNEQLRSKLPTHWHAIGRGTTAPAKCYRPAVFFHHVGLIALSFLQGKLLHEFQNVVASTVFLLS